MTDCSKVFDFVVIGGGLSGICAAVAAVTAVRFVADRVWGSEGKAHIFTLEYR